MPTNVRSHTKINLGLAIGPLRPDGFHQLTTVYQTLALYEWVTVEARWPQQTGSRSAALIRTCPPMPAIRRGGWWNAACKCFDVQAEVHIHIDKQLPRARWPGRRLGQCHRRAHRAPAGTRPLAPAAGMSARGC